MHGTVKRIRHKREFGYIGTEDGVQVFFNRTSLVDTRFEDLCGGEAVEFEVIQDRRGPRAMNVRLAASSGEAFGGTSSGREA